MPYTLSHPGFILLVPARLRQYVSMTGLVFGSIAPDFDILFRITEVRFHIFQYDLKCILLLICPLAFISAVFFHLFCRNILIDNLPSYYSEKYKQYKAFNFLQYVKHHFLRIYISILIAVLLHLFLDYITHYYDAHTTSVNVLEWTYNEQAGKIAYYSALYLLPVLFSLIGFVLTWKLVPLSFKLKHLLLTHEKAAFWSVVIFVTALVSFIKIFFTKRDAHFQLDIVIISITSSLIISVYAVCILYFFKQHFQKKKGRNYA